MTKKTPRPSRQDTIDSAMLRAYTLSCEIAALIEAMPEDAFKTDWERGHLLDYCDGLRMHIGCNTPVSPFFHLFD